MSIRRRSKYSISRGLGDGVLNTASQANHFIRWAEKNPVAESCEAAEIIFDQIGGTHEISQISILFPGMSVFCWLTACGDTSNTLSGTYSLESFGVITSYTFSEDGVTAQFFMVGYEIGRYEGTYSLNDDRTQITLSFDPAPAENHVELPPGLLSLGGTFSFQEEGDHIVIGQIKYYRSDVKAEDFTPSSVSQTS